MSFFDNWEEPPAKVGSYITKEEKDKMAAEAVPFTIEAVTFESGGGYQGADRFLVRAMVRWPDEQPVERLLSFSTQEGLSRTELLYALVKYFAETGEEAVSPVCYLEKAGAAYLIRNYEGSEAELNSVPFG